MEQGHAGSQEAEPWAGRGRAWALGEHTPNPLRGWVVLGSPDPGTPIGQHSPCPGASSAGAGLGPSPAWAGPGVCTLALTPLLSCR